jgi:hypothetical protein
MASRMSSLPHLHHGAKAARDKPGQRQARDIAGNTLACAAAARQRSKSAILVLSLCLWVRFRSIEVQESEHPEQNAVQVNVRGGGLAQAWAGISCTLSA